MAPSVRYAHQRPLQESAPKKSFVRLHRMIIPGILLALETSEKNSGQNDEELARRLQRRDPAPWPTSTTFRQARIFRDLCHRARFRDGRGSGAGDFPARMEPDACVRSGRGALGPWLLAIARNRAIDHVRSLGARMDRNCTSSMCGSILRCSWIWSATFSTPITRASSDGDRETECESTKSD